VQLGNLNLLCNYIGNWGILRMTTDFDTLFGASKAPNRTVTDVEKSFKPNSVVVLDQATAPLLMNHMKAAEAHTPGTTLHQFIPFLWLIRDDGNLVVAVEEIFDTEIGRSVGVFAGQTDKRESKLGHPALTDHPRYYARIAGELRFDRGQWLLTNASGRYGDVERTSEEQLQNVAKEFEKYHIQVKARYVKR